MRLLAWNIRQGRRLASASHCRGAGASRGRHSPVLSEYRGGQSATRLLTALDTPRILATRRPSMLPPGGHRRANRRPLLPSERTAPVICWGSRTLSDRRCRVRLVPTGRRLFPEPARQGTLLGGADRRVARQTAAAPALAIGDFNTCRPYLDEAGAIDLDRALHGPDRRDRLSRPVAKAVIRSVREFSWFITRGNGFRIDHAFLSNALACVLARSAMRTKSASPASPITRR